jgi:hypothetical protein
MKVTKIGSGKPASTGIASMPSEMRKTLDGMTIEQALASGKINDLGTAKGVFAVPHKDENISRWYGIVQGYAVPLSKAASSLCEDGKLNNDVIANMKFQAGISNVEGDGNGKAWFNLGLGGTLNLDLESEFAVSIAEAEPVDHK